MFVGLLHQLGLNISIADCVVSRVKDAMRDNEEIASDQDILAAIGRVMQEEEIKPGNDLERLFQRAMMAQYFIQSMEEFRSANHYVVQIDVKDWRLCWRQGDEVWIHGTPHDTWIGAEMLRRMERKPDWRPNGKLWNKING